MSYGLCRSYYAATLCVTRIPFELQHPDFVLNRNESCPDRRGQRIAHKQSFNLVRRLIYQHRSADGGPRQLKPFSTIGYGAPVSACLPGFESLCDIERESLPDFVIGLQGNLSINRVAHVGWNHSGANPGLWRTRLQRGYRNSRTSIV